MGRRSPRRMWHAIAALVPLPLIGLGYVAAVPGHQTAFEVELYLSGPGSAYPLTRTADASAPHQPLTRAAAQLFGAGGKGPRADRYASAQAVTDAGKQLITASLTGAPGFTRALAATNAVSRDGKGDRLKPTTTDVALKGPVGGRADSSLFMNVNYASPFNETFDVDSFRPSPEETAYHPTTEGLDFRYKGESQAEFEARERRCLSTAIYFEARGEPVRGQIAVGQVILNRVRSPIFPETICGVVYQGQMQKGCQFSFTCDGRTDNPRDDDQWALAQDIAKQIMSGEAWLPEVGYSTFYHANYVSPRWARAMNKIDRIGRHIFYKKRNEEPYVVEASTDSADSDAESDDDSSSFSLTPTLSLASAVTAVSAVAGSTTPPTPAMSLGYARSE
jgi:spore germination cell wall hydrolase CwlJ-like protein